MAELYGAITSGGVFRAASIKAAEAAKAIENAQRDINIAFMNEIAQILSKIGVSVWDVLAAAQDQVEFPAVRAGAGRRPLHRRRPLLSEPSGAAARAIIPQVILSGRAINDGMGGWVADALHERLAGKAGRTLVLGLTFKEDVPDLRNSRVFDLVGRLRELGHSVDVADPLADPDEVGARVWTGDDQAQRRALRPGRRSGRPLRISRSWRPRNWKNCSRRMERLPT